MKHSLLFALCMACTMLVMSCHSSKGGSDINAEDIGEGDLAEELNTISYELDWSEIRDGIKPIVKDGLHVKQEIVEKEVEDEVWDDDSLYHTEPKTVVDTTYYKYVQGNWRFVLVDGEKIVYDPNITIDDLGIIGTKEAVINLAHLKMRTDPRINNDNDFIYEMLYYLLYRDKSVEQHYKDIATQHYQAACNAFEEEGDLQKQIGTSALRIFWSPSSTSATIFIKFRYDKDGFLQVKSKWYDYDGNVDPSENHFWIF